MKRIFTVLVLAFGLSGNTGAETNMELLKDCEADQVYKQMYCLGFIQGVRNTISFSNFYYPIHKRSGAPNSNLYNYCQPENVSSGQLQKVVIKYLNNNPETLHNDGFYGVMRALEQAFPCPPE